MGGVCRDISTFVVTMQGKVESKKIDKSLIVGLSKHSSIVVRPILLYIDFW